SVQRDALANVCHFVGALLVDGDGLDERALVHSRGLVAAHLPVDADQRCASVLDRGGIPAGVRKQAGLDLEDRWLGPWSLKFALDRSDDVTHAERREKSADPWTGRVFFQTDAGRDGREIERRAVGLQ